MNDRWHVDLQSLQTIEVGNKGFNNAVSITITSKSLVESLTNRHAHARIDQTGQRCVGWCVDGQRKLRYDDE